MLTGDRSFLSRYPIAIASVALALLLASILSSRADPSHFTLFFAAVMVSAWYGGLGAGWSLPYCRLCRSIIFLYLQSIRWFLTGEPCCA